MLEHAPLPAAGTATKTLSDFALTGVVLVLDEELGVGYVQDHDTGRRFGISRKFLPPHIWAQLRQGQSVRFKYDARRNTVSTLEVVD